MAKKKINQPTESELEILQILWEKGKSSVREVHETLEQTRDIGYTTTLKTMQIMTEKDLLKRDTALRTHIYLPVIQQQEVEKSLINKIRKNLFKDSASRLVIGALNNSPLSQNELNEIRDFINNYKQK
jgi:BlaI family transcriptional regulator, penicillinase repressor